MILISKLSQATEYVINICNIIKSAPPTPRQITPNLNYASNFPAGTVA